MGKPNKEHKHIWIGKYVYSVYLKNQFTWICGNAWGPTPYRAAKVYHKHLSSKDYEAQSVKRLHEQEGYLK